VFDGSLLLGSIVCTFFVYVLVWDGSNDRIDSVPWQ
jgi:hypothetical protein